MKKQERTRRTAQHTGFTLVELLVSMLLSGIAIGVIAKDFTHSVHTKVDMDQVAEAQQALRAAMTFVSQEVRQAGACLPELGNFVALDGTDGGDRDTLTLRIGRADAASLVCVRTILTAAAGETESTLTVEDAGDFSAGGYIYVTRAAGNGDTFKIASVSGNQITVEGQLGADFIVGGGVYAIEERAFEIQELDGQSVLMMSIDGGDMMPMATGVTKFDVKYRLDPCPPCTSVDLPANNSQWRTVREVEIRVATETKAELQSGEQFVLESTTTIKPRNLL
jgi:prepilin-type N-terminal cleavage/methylation domain-containing protein